MEAKVNGMRYSMEFLFTGFLIVFIGSAFISKVDNDYKNIIRFTDEKINMVSTEIRHINELRYMKRIIDDLSESVFIKKFEITAYLCVDTKEGRTSGITKSGEKCRPDWSVASWPKEIPFGSLIIDVENKKVGKVTDTGNLITKGKLDIAVNNRKEAVSKYGRKKRNVIVINPDKFISMIVKHDFRN